MATHAIAPDDDRIEQLFRKQRANQANVKRSTATERIAKLEKLRAAILEREGAIREAMFKDFRKSATEVDITEIYASLVELKDAIKSLRKWMKPQPVTTPLALFGTRSHVNYEPKGVVLIIGPWNYPFQLIIAPLVAAIAAGNCVICKPSELTEHTAKVIVELLAAVFSEDEVGVVEGGPAETQRLLALPFDHFFFTGSTKVGRIVAEAAAKHLASTTLELGGKSPAVIDDSADIALTANRIVWGKFVNGGQTCIAPDYVFVSEQRQAELVDELRKSIAAMYGASEDDRKKSPDLCRVINSRNFDRLKKMLDDSVSQGAKVEIGGGTDADERYIAPTVLTERQGRAAGDGRGDLRPDLAGADLQEAVRRAAVHHRARQAARALRVREQPASRRSDHRQHDRGWHVRQQLADPLREHAPAVRRRRPERHRQLPRVLRLQGVLARARRAAPRPDRHAEDGLPAVRPEGLAHAQVDVQAVHIESESSIAARARALMPSPTARA